MCLVHPLMEALETLEKHVASSDLKHMLTLCISLKERAALTVDHHTFLEYQAQALEELPEGDYLDWTET